MLRSLLLLCMLPPALSAGCDCTTTCLTTSDSPSAAWCEVDYTTCSSALWRYSYTTWSYIAYVYCSTGTDSSVTCECASSWTDNAGSWTSDPSTCSTTQSGCPDTACNNMEAYAYTYGIVSWCVVGNAPCKDAPANPSGSAYMKCTPTETATSCDCRSSWTYMGKTYTGCQTTQDSPSSPWCMVDWTCNSASFGYDTTTNTSFPYKSCTDGLDTSVTCTCDAAGCVNAATPYCVAATTPCATAPKPTAGMDAYVTCTPTDCECQDTWTYSSDTYTGCSTTPDSPSAPWCFVKSDNCSSAYAKNDTAGITSKWKYCTDGLDSTKTCSCSGSCVNDATPYCELGNAPCATSPPVNPAGKAYGTCTPTECECLASWTYDGTSHSGCDGTVDSYGYTWCIVDSTCKEAVSGTDPSSSATFYSLYCDSSTSAPSTAVPVTTNTPTTDPCACLSAWYYNYTYYYGCQTTRDGTAPWCMVNSTCTDSPLTGYDSTDGFSFYYKFCSDGLDASVTCTCTGGCVNADTPYCAVANAPCDVAPSPSPSNVGAFMYCVPDACKCLDSWTYNGTSHAGCDGTAVDSYGYTWCAVDSSCKSAASGTDPSSSVTFYSLYCSVTTSAPSTPVPATGAPATSSPSGTSSPTDPCACLSTWYYNYTYYYGCQTTRDGTGPWCMVDGACTDSPLIGYDSTNNYFPFYYKACTDGVDASVTCTCSGDCVNAAVPYCAVANAPCNVAPSPSPSDVGAFMYCVPDVCACLDSWTYNGTSHSGCDGATDSYGYTWCAVSSSCNAAANITDYYNGATIYALYCTMNMTTSVPETYVPGTPPTLAPPTNSPTDACACLSTWYYNYTYYNGCQTTRDGTAPWCMVSGACANSPLIGYDSTSNFTFYYKICSDGLNSSVACTCSGDCVNAAVPYCAVANAPCDVAPSPSPSDVGAYMYCVPDVCQCLDSWTYNTQEYTGCSTTPDSPSNPWCYVSDECAVAYEKNTTLGITSKWKYCSDGLDSTKTCTCSGSCVNAAIPYCELGNAPCASSPPANPAGKAYGICTPSECECLDSWSYAGATFSGCDANAVNSYGYTWCAVSSSCAASITTIDPTTGTSFASAYCSDASPRGASGSSGLSNAAVAGIAVGCTAGVAIIGVGIYAALAMTSKAQVATCHVV